tara:strand:+ start:107 stop:655 length:549 start_codon:yes stop_codon:yes gene_type:complete
MNDLVKKIEAALKEFAEKHGAKVMIGPVTADMIERRRSMASDVSARAEEYALVHTGWSEIMASLNIVDSATRYSFSLELAEEWEVPVSFPLCFDYNIQHEPARMYAVCKGMLPLVHEGCSTPQLLRVAWDGAQAGLWDAEDVLQLPPPMMPLSSEAMEMITNNADDTSPFQIQGVDTWFTEA